MKTKLVLNKWVPKMAPATVNKELEEMFLMALDAWLTTVAKEGGGSPWSGETLGSLRPVADFLDKKRVIGLGSTVLEDRINSRVIQTYEDWFKFKKGQSWRFHLTKFGKKTDLIKTPDLGAKVQKSHFNVDLLRDLAIFRFSFEPQIYQFLKNEKTRGISHSAPWKALEKGRKAYKATLKQLYANSVRLKKWGIKRIR